MDIRYPIGRFAYAGESTADQRRAFIDRIENTPARLSAAVAGLAPEQLDTPYRPGGWTVRQVVHHVPDSHMNSYCRFRLALTEDTPSAKGYYEDRWAELFDARTAPIQDAIHDGSGFRPHVSALRTGTRHARSQPRAIRLARRSSRGAHHRPARPHGMALSVDEVLKTNGLLALFGKKISSPNTFRASISNKTAAYA